MKKLRVCFLHTIKKKKKLLKQYEPDFFKNDLMISEHMNNKQTNQYQKKDTINLYTIQLYIHIM